MKTLIIDNYDSFTYNLYQAIAIINHEEPIVIYHDTHSISDIFELNFDNIVLSPGPGHPANSKDFGICSAVITQAQVPILGICLGHQGIVHHFGGEISHAPMPIHGQRSKITHQNDALFANIPPSFYGVRYHSLIASDPLPHVLKAIAHTEDKLIMGVKHQTRPIWGIQYHPESICSEYGLELLKNFKNLTPTKKRKPFLPPKKSSKPSYQFKLDVQEIVVQNPHTHLWIKAYENQSHVIWLDSSLLVSDVSRFSIWGDLNGPLSYHLQYDMQAKRIIKTTQQQQEIIEKSIFEYLEQELKHFVIEKTDLPFDFACGFIGYFGYELYQETLNIKAKHPSPHPDAQFLFLDRALVYDHQTQRCYQLTLIPIENQQKAPIWFHPPEGIYSKTTSFKTPNPELSQSALEYQQKIEKCLESIRNGESYEICLTNRLRYPTKLDGQDLYQQLRKTQSAPYGAYCRFQDLEIACASMERFLKIDQEGNIETKPIKGTIARGTNPIEDEAHRQQLQSDIKFRSENLMIVDLLRNDLGKVCEIGSIQVPQLMAVESYQTVHQLVSTISGKLKNTVHPIDCIKALFPGGSMTGAPKIRTVEIIQELETSYRGIYSGALGYLSLNGAVDLNIVIRTAIMTPHLTEIGMGGAIIALSDTQSEFEETLLKTKSLQQAILKLSSTDTSLLESTF